METGSEYITLVNELTEGLELTKQLKFHMNSNSSIKTQELLLERILSSYDKALSVLVLKWNGSVLAQLQPVSPTITGVPDSSISVDTSPRSEEFERGYKENLDNRDVSKKRKVLPTWTDQVRVCSETGLEGPIDDGYSWRKYGQKDILGAKYPRSYYRCTYRNMQNCWATKQVQRTDSDPTIFEITYRGTHTCSTHASNKAPAPTSPEKQEAKETNHQNIHHQQSPNELLMNFRTNLRVHTEVLDSKEKDSPFTFPSTSFKRENPNFPISTLAGDTFLGSFSQSSIISPATSESNYFTDILSANTSATNSPIVDLDFSIEPINLDPDFPFDILGFFN